MSLFVFVEYDIISKMWATWKESDKLSEIGQIIRNGTNIVGLNKVENITICCLFLFFSEIYHNLLVGEYKKMSTRYVLYWFTTDCILTIAIAYTVYSIQCTVCVYGAILPYLLFKLYTSPWLVQLILQKVQLWVFSDAFCLGFLIFWHIVTNVGWVGQNS